VSMENEPANEPVTESDALVSRLRVIEDQPLDQRATAFTQVHDQLQARLAGGDTPAVHG